MNPNASRIRAAGGADALLPGLADAVRDRHGVAPEVVVPPDAATTVELARAAAAAGVPLVVGVGGDGTQRAIATGIAGSDTQLGIVPGGTGNILAGVLGIPDDLGTAAELLRTGRSRRIDIGDVTVDDVERAPGTEPERTICAIGCGIGFDARLMATTASDHKQRFGRYAYLLQAVRLAASIGTVPYHLVVDGREIEVDASVAMVTNVGEIIPGVVGPRLPAVPDDGLLDLFVVGAGNALEGIRGLADQLLRTGTGGGPGSRTLRFRCTSARLASTPPEPIQVDGDPHGVGSLDITIRPAALSVIVPAT